MATVTTASGPMCSLQALPMLNKHRFTSFQRSLSPAPRRVQRSARLVTEAARRNDNSGRNRIGRSMDDNASTDESWWKMWQASRKRQVKPAQGRGPAFESLEGMYSAERAAAADQSGTVGRAAAGKGTAGDEASAQLTDGLPLESTAPQDGSGAADAKKRRRRSRFLGLPAQSNYSSANLYHSSADNNAAWLPFDNAFMIADWQTHAKAQPSDDASCAAEDSCNDSSVVDGGGGWFSGVFGNFSGPDDIATEADDTIVAGRTTDDHFTSYGVESSDGGEIETERFPERLADTFGSGSHPSDDSSTFDSSSSNGDGGSDLSWDLVSSHQDDMSHFDNSSGSDLGGLGDVGGMDDVGGGMHDFGGGDIGGFDAGMFG